MNFSSFLATSSYPAHVTRLQQGFQGMDALVVQLLDRAQDMADNPNDIIGVPTSFHDLDRMTSGLQAGDLVVLTAPPSMGKTALAINIAELQRCASTRSSAWAASSTSFRLISR